MLFKKNKTFLLLLIIVIVAVIIVGCNFGDNLLGETRELEIEVVGAGDVNISEGTNYYYDNATVTIEAIPDEGAVFDSWSGDVDNRHENPTNILMDGDKEILPVFRVEGEALGTAIVSDVSGSMSGVMGEQIDGLKTFIRRMNADLDMVGLYAFSSSSSRRLNFGKVDRDNNNSGTWDIIEEVNKLDAGGGTALWDATIDGINMASNAENEYEHVMSSVLVFTDGEDNRSSAGKQDVINTAQSAGISVYIVGLDPRPDFGYDPVVLRDVSEATGGTFYDTPTPTELQNLYQEIYTDLHR